MLNPDKDTLSRLYQEFDPVDNKLVKLEYYKVELKMYDCPEVIPEQRLRKLGMDQKFLLCVDPKDWSLNIDKQYQVRGGFRSVYVEYSFELN